MLISFDFESFQRCKNLFAEEGISSGNITMHAQTSSPNRQFQNSDIDFDDVKHQDASNCSESHCSARNTKSNGLRLAVRARNCSKQNTSCDVECKLSFKALIACGCRGRDALGVSSTQCSELNEGKENDRKEGL